MTKKITILFIGAILLVSVLASGCTTSNTSNVGNTTSTSTQNMSESDYKAASKQIAVSDLTKNADNEKGKLVKMTGQIVVFEESGNVNSTQKTTKLIISVKDEANTTGTGVLPVYVTYQGALSQFINDNVTVYGQVYGNDVYKSSQIAAKTLPRVDARYIENA